MNISTKTSTEVTETTIKEVSTELNINKKHVKTHVKLDMDGKTILDEDGHSILANFGRYLEHLMCGTRPIVKTTYYPPYGGVVSRSGVNLRITTSASTTLTSGDKTAVLYAPDYPDIHLTPFPVSAYTTSSPYSFTLACDISSSDYDSLIGESIQYCVFHNGGTRFRHPGGSYPGVARDTLGLVVGANSAPVTIDDFMFFDVKTGASATAVNITFDSAKDETYLSVSCSYTNSSDTPIIIREIGLRSLPTESTSYNNISANGTAHRILLARDVIDEVTIPVGRTLNITYTIMSKVAKSTGTGGANTDSGFVNNMLHGFCAIVASQSQIDPAMTIESGATQTVTRYVSGSYDEATRACGDWLFCGSAKAQSKSRMIASNYVAGTGLHTWRPGVLLCSSTNDTQDVTNYVPVSEIPNGTGAGELEYLMSWGEEGTLDSTSYSFTLKRLVHNRSGAEIIVRALALICGVRNTAIGALVNNLGALLAQTNLDPTDFITIPNGKMCIVSYTIKVEI